MAENENVTTKLQVDVTDFKKGLSDANRYIRLANSEFEKATAGVGKFTDSADGLRAKLTQLEKTLEGQEAAASVLRAEYERVCKEQGENSKGAQELAVKLNKQEAACKKTASQIEHYQAALSDAQNEGESLTKTVSDQEKKLAKLKEEYIDVAASQGKGSKEAKALAAEIAALSKDLQTNKKRLDDAEQGAREAAGEYEKAEKSAGGFAKKLASFAGKSIVAGIKGIATAAGGLATAFLATGETSKEWIGNMNKLEAVAQDAGRSTQDVKAQFTEFYGILGDETAATTTASNLEAIGLSQENLASVTNSMAGIWSKYGDSIPLDGLAESINETSKAGQVTGNLADALNWAGISEDQFNEKLAACSSEQERQQLIVDTLDGTYGKLGETYKEQNKAIIDSNKANAALQDSLAGVGEVAMPIMSTLKLLGASLLNDMLPGVKQLGEAFTGLLNGEAGAAGKLGSALSGLLTTAINKIVEMAPTIIQAGISLITSLVSSFTSMAPTLATTAMQLITDVCVALIGMIPQLVTLGIELIMGLLEGLTSAIPQIVQAVVDMIPQLVQALVTGIPLLIQGAVQLLLAICDAIPVLLQALIPQIPTIVMAIVNGLLDNLGPLLQGAITLLLAIVDAIPVLIQTLVPLIPSIVTAVIEALIENIPILLEGAVQLFMALVQAIPTICMELLKAIPDIIGAIFEGLAPLTGKLGEFFTGAWEGIKNVFSGVGEWFGEKFTEAKEKTAQAWSSAKTWASDTWGNVKDGFAGVGSWFKQKFDEGNKNAKSAFSGAKTWASGAWAKVKSGFGSVGSWFKDTFAGAWSKVKQVFAPVGDFFGGLWDKIKSKFSSLGSSISDAIGGAVKSGINRVISFIENTINKAIGLINGAIGLINKLPGVSVSKVATVSLPRLYRGGVLKKGQVGLLEGSGAEAVVPLENNRKWIRKVAAEFRNQMAGGYAAAPGPGSAVAGGATYVFNQYNNSPKALSRAEIYRQTKNQLRFATQA